MQPRPRRTSSVLRSALAAVALLTPLSAVAPLSACGDDTGGSGGQSCNSELDEQGCFDETCWTQIEGRSFRADVLPILERSCSLSSACHGDATSPSTSAGYRPYLGSVDEQANPSDIEAIRAVLIGQKSPSSPLALVEPGRPADSYLMHKVDGSLDCGRAACGDLCGQAMPDPNALLPRSDRDTLRDWIAQGALDN
jgi:hypothetical protein